MSWGAETPNPPSIRCLGNAWRCLGNIRALERAQHFETIQTLQRKGVRIYLQLAICRNQAGANCPQDAVLFAQAEFYDKPIELKCFVRSRCQTEITVESRSICSSDAPNDRRPISCESCAISGSANMGQCPRISCITSGSGLWCGALEWRR